MSAVGKLGKHDSWCNTSSCSPCCASSSLGQKHVSMALVSVHPSNCLTVVPAESETMLNPFCSNSWAGFEHLVASHSVSMYTWFREASDMWNLYPPHQWLEGLVSMTTDGATPYLGLGVLA
eukprot:scaffold26270_cov31-Prasinocladus_malaysianus.AAC.1